MRIRNLPLLACLIAVPLAAQEAPPKLQDYPAHARIGEFTVGAENLGPSIPTPSGGLYLDDYIVIEIAVFPSGQIKAIQLAHANFALRINGSKSLIRPDTPEFVAAAVKYPNWERQRGLVATAGIGNAGVTLGRNDPVERFPGDRRPIEQRRPVPNPVPRVDSPIESKKEEVPVDEQVRRAAYPEVERVLPVKGALYFHYTGKLKKVKSLELTYDGPLGAASIRIP